MRRIGWIIGVVMLLAWVPRASAATPEYFTFPAGYGVDDWGVTADGAGNVWFTAKSPSRVIQQPPAPQQPTPSLGRLIPAQASPGTSNGIAFFPLPDPANVNCCANQARGVTFNPVDGKLYYVRDDGGIGSALPSALVPGTTDGFDSTTLPGNVDLWDVAPSPAGGVWFTEHSASNVGPTYYGDRLAYYNGAVSEGPNIAIQNGGSGLSPSRFDAKPSGVAVDAAGRPWFVEEDASDHGYRIATYGGSGDHYDEYMISPCEGTTPCSGSNGSQALTDVAIAPDGGVWFTNYLNKKFGRFDPVTHQMVQYTLTSIGPTLAGGQPWHITAAPDGTLWMTTRPSSYAGLGNAIVRIVPTSEPTATVTKLTTDAFALGIGADNAGNIWFGTSDNKLGRLAGVVGVTPAPPADQGTGVTPPTSTTTTTPTSAPVTPPTSPPVVLKPAAVGTSRLTPPQTDNGAINTNQICVGPPEARCSLVYLIKEHEYVTGFPSSVSKKRKKHQPRVLGTKTVTLHGGQNVKVTVKLNKLGKRILKGKHKLKVVFSATQKLANGKTKTVTKKTLTLRSK
jgi:streptogramin lyase